MTDYCGKAVTLENTSKNLLDDLHNDDLVGWFVSEFPMMKPDGFIDGNKAWQVVFCPAAGRAGLVFVGSGSSGHTHWTDADSPEHAVDLILADELVP